MSLRSQEKTMEQIEQEMARTRAEIDRTAQALKDKATPRSLGVAAQQAIVEGAAKVEEKMEQLAQSAEPAVQSLGDDAVNYFKNNPFPALIVGLGVGVIISMAERENRQGQADRMNQRVRNAEQAMASQSVLDRAPKVAELQRKTVLQARRMNRKHPLLLGAAVFGVGILLGTLLPPTRREDELFGPHRDQLFESSKESAQELAHRAKSMAEEEVQKRRTEASELKDSVEAAAVQAFHDARGDDATRVINPSPRF